jgi:hypothetical protein
VRPDPSAKGTLALHSPESAPKCPLRAGAHHIHGRGEFGQTRFKSAEELETTLKRYLTTYNHRIPQKVLHHLSPIQALKQWQCQRPDLFNKRAYEMTGLDK